MNVAEQLLSAVAFVVHVVARHTESRLGILGRTTLRLGQLRRWLSLFRSESKSLQESLSHSAPIALLHLRPFRRSRCTAKFITVIIHKVNDLFKCSVSLVTINPVCSVVVSVSGFCRK